MLVKKGKRRLPYKRNGSRRICSESEQPHYGPHHGSVDGVIKTKTKTSDCTVDPWMEFQQGPFRLAPFAEVSGYENYRVKT